MNASVPIQSLYLQLIDSIAPAKFCLPTNYLRNILTNTIELLLLPSMILYGVTIEIASRYYQYTASNARLITQLNALFYFLNILAIPAIIMFPLGYLTLVPYILGVAFFFIIFTALNRYKYKNILSRKEEILADIDAQISDVIKKEKNIEKRLIKAEALLAMKDLFTKLNAKPLTIAYAITSAVFLVKKQASLAKESNLKRFKALELETAQLSKLLATV